MLLKWIYKYNDLTKRIRQYIIARRVLRHQSHFHLHGKRIPMTQIRPILLILNLLGLIGATACSNNAAQSPTNSDAKQKTASADTDSDVRFEEVNGTESSISNTFFQNDGGPLAEECCTAVGKLDECWWEDAIQDGITCRSHADCPQEIRSYFPSGDSCYIKSGESLGVCKCKSDVTGLCASTTAGQEREGVCVADTDTSGTEIHICGPSFCNGYLKCSCFGGCEWWDQENLTNTPNKVVEGLNEDTDNNVFCCEGSYPLGADKIITFYGNGGCDDATINPGCNSDADCPVSSTCVSYACNGTTGECDPTYNNGVSCSTDTDTTDCVSGATCNAGSCVVPAYETSGTACGTDTSATDCYGVGACDTAGTCLPVPVGSGTACGTDTSATDCQLAGSCDAAGTCVPISEADGTACGVDSVDTDCVTSACVSGVCSTTYPLALGTSCSSGPDGIADNCVEGWQCDGAGNCYQQNTTAGTTCAFDEVRWDPSCYAAYCGAVTDSNWEPTFDATTFTGFCEVITRDAPANDDCDGAEQLGTGAVANTFEGVVASVTASTGCATNDYFAAHSSCVEPSGVQLGAGANDLVYYFDYVPTSTSQQDLYAFVITVESDVSAATTETDVHAVVYTQNDVCDGSSSNRCLFQSENDATGTPPPVPWEYHVNVSGRDWDLEDQNCAAGDYEWCERTYNSGGSTWTYPASPTECTFDSGGTYDCASTAGNVAQTVVFPTSNVAATTERVYIFVDGAEATAGTFTLTLERLLWNNGACERVTDAPRVYDITEIPASGTGVYQGNLTGYANSDHSSTTTTCGGYDCTETWEGWTAYHGGASGNANAFWPNAAYFKLQPTANTTYCLQTDQGAIANAITPVVEVRHLTQSGDNEKDLCQGEYTQETVGLGENGIEFSAIAGNSYLVLVSEEGPNAENDGPCTTDCNYKLTVADSECPSSCYSTIYEAEDTHVADGGPTTDGWNLWAPWVYLYTDHPFDGEETIDVIAWGQIAYGVWPEMEVLIDGVVVDTVTVDSASWDTYSFAIPRYTSTNEIQVRFTNDTATGAPEDRNLYVDKFIVRCDDVLPTPPNTVTIEEIGLSAPYDPGSDPQGLCSVGTGGATQNNAGYEGSVGGYGNTDNFIGADMTWSVNAAYAGTVTLSWRYANGGIDLNDSSIDRPGTLRINGVDVASDPFVYSGAWNTWTNTPAHNVTLNAGTNSISLIAENGLGLAIIDSMTVVGAGVSEGDCP